MLLAQVHLTLPVWIHEAIDTDRVYPHDDAKMALAIELSQRNIEANSGGPFGAALFDRTDRVLAVGVNRVQPMACSLAHAENMACMLAQQRLQRARLNVDASLDATGGRIGRYTLATSSQPCCQCYGAVIWAGIDRLLIGARSQDVMQLTGFDEGPLPEDWLGELARRGIEVVRDLRRAAACDVLQRYGQSGGAIY